MIQLMNKAQGRNEVEQTKCPAAFLFDISIRLRHKKAELCRWGGVLGITLVSIYLTLQG